ncbi:MAG: dockerin type I repeat-containing protein [Phycisphaerae bacterium]|nr:dockerin type I repeat-containing protein [Phycisphaerae bacterium]
MTTRPASPNRNRNLASRCAALAVAAVAASAPAFSASWLHHLQRVQYPLNVGARSVEIERDLGGGYIYLADHISPLILSAGANTRPIFVRTSAKLEAQTCYTYLRPGEWNTLYATDLYLLSTDFATTADRGFIICGNYAEIGADEGAFLLKVDENLTPQWFRQFPERQLGNFINDIAFNSIVETTQNGAPIYAVAGSIFTTTNQQALIAAFDSQGFPMWSQEILGTEGLWGEAAEVINYDADSIAIVGTANVAPHDICNNFLAQGDVLVAILQNDGLFEFAGIFGQTTGQVNSTPVTFAERGNSIARVNGSADLMLTGSITAWRNTGQECGSPLIDAMLAFRVTPVGGVIWANRYSITSGNTDLTGVQIKPITAFAMIVADGWTTLNGFWSQNVAYFRLMAGNGSLAAQTELFGGPGTERAAGILPEGPPWPQAATILGTSDSFANGFHSDPKPWLIGRMPSARRTCEDATVFTTIVPVPLPPHDFLINAPQFPLRSQPLVLISQTVSDWLICANTIIGDINGDGGVTVGDIGGFVLALTDPAAYAVAFPDGDLEAADINDDGVISVGDISGFVQLLTGGA